MDWPSDVVIATERMQEHFIFGTEPTLERPWAVSYICAMRMSIQYAYLDKDHAHSLREHYSQVLTIMLTFYAHMDSFNMVARTVS